jgi:hypothetical protein
LNKNVQIIHSIIILNFSPSFLVIRHDLCP